jgi:hypothetical protein
VTDQHQHRESLPSVVDPKQDHARDEEAKRREGHDRMPDAGEEQRRASQPGHTPEVDDTNG